MGQIIGNVMVQKRGVISLGLLKGHLPVEDGDVLQVQVEDGRIVLVPMKLVPADQVWFWSTEWQKGEKEADEDIAEGRTKSFDSVDELLEDLDK
ncbi:MAG: AbrB/MazE/SpoVT family DNA-binding domain-containing protein [Peptococcaceae bacterium]|nr:AbrB/MazE/SpoVT family DNA-binding domain-containing protein [Peptococcaceae bacterium]